MAWIAGDAGTRARERLEPLVLVAVGGFLGAVLRYAVALVAPAGPLPWATLVANVCGSFALGVVLYESVFAGVLTRETRLVVATGLLSSFTTYSTFAVETAGLPPGFAALNVGLNYGLGFAAVLGGRAVARWVVA